MLQRHTAPSNAVALISDCLTSSRFSRSEIEGAVAREIEGLRLIAEDSEPDFGRQGGNRQHAKKIAALLKKLLRAINDAPGGTRQALYSFGRFGVGLPPRQLIDYEEVARYKVRFHFYVESMGRACSILQHNKIGWYQTEKPEKLLCANSAVHLIAGLEAGEFTNADDGSPVRVIAGILFGDVYPQLKKDWKKKHREFGDSDDDELDLKHQCRKVIADWKSLQPEERETAIAQCRSQWGLSEKMEP